MSYEVLAQRWRPQSFSDVVGQEHVTTTLKNQILSERIGHAYLFWGPRGTGKTTVARILAKAVNCPNRSQETQFDTSETAEPCNDCVFCEEISHGRALDVLEMDAASNRGVDTIRDLRENVKLSPATCTYKIYIIDEAHMLSTEAFNALLKTLEEPPPHVLFIMATTEHAKIPKTISSRCQDFDFRHLENEKVIERLQLIAETEEISTDPDVLTLITRQSEGCLRDAENLLERLVSSAGKELTVDAVEQIIGLGSSSLLRKLTTAIIGRDLAKSLKTLNNLAKHGTDLSQCLDQLVAYFRDLRLLAIDDGLSEMVQSPQSDLPELKEKAERMSVNRLSRIIKILMQTDRDIKTYGYPQLQLEAAFIQMNSLEEGIPLQEIVDKLSELEQKLDTAGFSARRDEVTSKKSAEIPEQSAENTEAKTPASKNPGPSDFQLPDRQTPSTQASIPKSQDPAPSTQPDSGDSLTSITDEAHPTTPDSADSPVSLTSPPAETAARDLADLPLFWEDIKSKLPMGRIRNGLLDKSVPTVNGTNTVSIACSASFLPTVRDEDEKIIADALSQEVGITVNIELVALDTATEPTVDQDGTEKQERKTAYIRRIEAQDDPQLKTALNLFEATVLETQ